jgi:hypothetical protein
VSDARAGSTAEIALVRDGRRLTVKVNIVQGARTPQTTSQP